MHLGRDMPITVYALHPYIYIIDLVIVKDV